MTKNGLKDLPAQAKRRGSAKIEVEPNEKAQAVKITFSGMQSKPFSLELKKESATRFLTRVAEAVGQAFGEPVALLVNGALIEAHTTGPADDVDEGLREEW